MIGSNQNSEASLLSKIEWSPQSQEKTANLECAKCLYEAILNECNSVEFALDVLKHCGVCNEKRNNDKRTKTYNWKDFNQRLCKFFDIRQRSSNGKIWKMNTIKTAGDMLKSSDLSSFNIALKKSAEKQGCEQVYEFLEVLLESFIKKGFIKPI